MSSNRVIGKDNKLPWHLPEDLKWFMEKTKNCPVIMGRKTHESIGMVLKNRTNVVITRDVNYKSKFENVLVYNDLQRAIDENNNDEVFIIGGQELFEQSINFADRIYLTIINTVVNGDTYFPELDNSWNKVHEQSGVDVSKYNYTFNIYEKINGSKRQL